MCCSPVFRTSRQYSKVSKGKSVTIRTCALRWLAHLRPAATRRAQCTEQKRPDPYVRSWAVPHDSQALAGAGATGDTVDAGAAAAAAAAPWAEVVPRPDGGTLPLAEPPVKRRAGFSGGPQECDAATDEATAALPLVATGCCFRGRAVGGGGEEEGDGVTADEGGVMAGESIDLDAGVYGAVQAAASGPKDLPRRGKDKQGQKVRLWHLHATERAATLPHPAVAMNAHVAKGAAAAQLLSSPEGQPTSPDTPPTYRMPATTLVTGTRRQRRGRRGSKQIASSSHTAPPNASSCSLPCPDSSFAPGRHDRQQVYRTHPQLSASLPPVIGVLSTTKRTAKASAALPTPCPRGRVTGAPIRGLAAPPTVAPTPCRRVRALGGMARDAPEHNAHSSNLASHVVRLLVPLAPAIAPTPTAKQAHRPALESFSLRATPLATLRAAARKGRPTAGRHGKCPGTPVAHHHQHHHLVHHCRGRGRRRQAVGASRPLPRWPPPP